jgi:hypothetical protein
MADMQLKDKSLFRQQCYIDGAWVDADSGDTINVNNPATDKILGTVPKMGADETRRAIEAANAAWPAWRAKTAKQRGDIIRRWYELMLENQDDRNRLCGLVPGMVCRGGPARLWRRDPAAHGRPPRRRYQGADRRLRRDHAMEFPRRDDYPQGRPGAGRRLPDGGQAGERDALFGAGPGRTG